MKAIRLFCIIFLALTTAMLLYQPAVASPIVDPIRPKCPAMNNNDMQQVIKQIDIPSRWGDYAILDRVGRCMLATSVVYQSSTH